MKANDQLYLLYDENCPLCAWYTKEFIKYGFINEEARLPYAAGINRLELNIDAELAKNKIALVNEKTGETLYGIDSLLQIFGRKLPIIKTIGNFWPIHFLLGLLYSFISFNRKVIAPVTTCSIEGKCAPSKSILWRIVYIVFAGTMVHLSVGFYFTTFLSEHLLGKYPPDIYLYTAQFAVQFAVFKLLKQQNFYDYAGHLATVSLFGAGILLFAGLGLNILEQFGIAIDFLAPFCFGIVLTTMFVLHSKRLQLLGYSNFLTLSWLLFRISIYALVFKLF